MTKQDLMKDLLDRYEQLESLKGCKSAYAVLELYIKKMERRLKELL